MIGWTGDQQFESDDFIAQTEQALRNIIEVLAEGGAGPEHLVRLTWYVTDCEEYLARLRELGGVYRDTIGTHYPAMALVQAVLDSKSQQARIAAPEPLQQQGEAARVLDRIRERDRRGEHSARLVREQGCGWPRECEAERRVHRLAHDGHGASVGDRERATAEQRSRAIVGVTLDRERDVDQEVAVGLARMGSMCVRMMC